MGELAQAEGRTAAAEAHEKLRALSAAGAASFSDGLCRHVIEHLSEPILVLNGIGRIDVANPAFLRMFGLRADEVVGRPLTTIVSLDRVHGGKLGRILNDLIEERRLTAVTTIHLNPSSGGRGEQILRVKARKLNGEFNHCLLQFEDATFVDEETRRLRKSHRLIEAARIATEIAHEVGNPLTAIRSAAQYCLEENPSESEFKEFLNIVVSNADEARKFLNQLMDYAAPREPEFTSISIGAPLNRALFLLKPQLRRSRITVLVHHDPDLPDLQADPGQIQELFVNVLSNAIRAIVPPGEIAVETRFDPRNGTVSCGIKNSGPHISEQLLPEIFEPFVTETEGGTGLGLSICLAIAECHGGSIRARNIPAGGVEVVLELPVSRVDGG